MAAPDKNQVRQRFSRSLRSYREAAIVQREMAEALPDLIAAATLRHDFPRIFEIGCGSGLLSELLAARFDYRQLILNDLAPDCRSTAERLPRAEFIPGDIEELELPPALDLIAANAVFQWLRDPAALLPRLAGKLNPDGLLALAVFGPGTCREIAELTGSSLAYRSAAAWRELLNAAGLEVIAGREEEIVLAFDDPEAVLRHLKLTGASANTASPNWTRRRLAAFLKDYRAAFGVPAGVTLTYHPILLLARLPRPPAGLE